MYPRLPSFPHKTEPIISPSLFSATKQVSGLRLRNRYIPSLESSILFSPIPEHDSHNE